MVFVDYGFVAGSLFTLYWCGLLVGSCDLVVLLLVIGGEVLVVLIIVRWWLLLWWALLRLVAELSCRFGFVWY